MEHDETLIEMAHTEMVEMFSKSQEDITNNSVDSDNSQTK
jgi:hypothetical protein